MAEEEAVDDDDKTALDCVLFAEVEEIELELDVDEEPTEVLGVLADVLVVVFGDWETNRATAAITMMTIITTAAIMLEIARGLIR